MSEARSEDESGSPELVVLRLVTGHWCAAAVHVAARLGVFDAIADSEIEVNALATRVNAHAPSLLRLLRALSVTGLFVEPSPGRFGLTEAGQLLRADNPRSIQAYALFEGAWPHWSSWGHLGHSVRTGESAYRHLFGKNFYEYCATDPEFAGWFDEALSKMSRDPVASLCDVYSFEGVREVVDVGGGLGTVLVHILERYPHLRGTLLDLPPVIRSAREVIRARRLTDRCRVIGGDFFASIPPGDLVIAKNILHNWNDEEVAVLLSRMREAVTPDGRLLFITLLLGTGEDSAWMYLADLEMLHIGGRQRTQQELEGLFARARLRLSNVQALASGHFAVEAKPV
jgi:cyclopropane fatty-acyl-phospholipid synthase-like methyltransferase